MQHGRLIHFLWFLCFPNIIIMQSYCWSATILLWFLNCNSDLSLTNIIEQTIPSRLTSTKIVVDYESHYTLILIMPYNLCWRVIKRLSKFFIDCKRWLISKKFYNLFITFYYQVYLSFVQNTRIHSLLILEQFNEVYESFILVYLLIIIVTDNQCPLLNLVPTVRHYA